MDFNGLVVEARHRRGVPESPKGFDGDRARRTDRLADPGRRQATARRSSVRLDHLKWPIQPDQDLRITGCPLTNGQRIVLTIGAARRKQAGMRSSSSEKSSTRLCIIGVELPGLSETC